YKKSFLFNFDISPAMRKIWLFVIAITIHNFPEGLAVGVGFGDGDIALIGFVVMMFLDNTLG
ncbi:MAG TPA: hypothetical protein GX498_09720, partial [Clostridiales bacterium]|nr:hypothetical protein [Clostridiales bacterium]